MRILHLTLGFYPAESWGGPLKVVHHLCADLVQRGHEVTVYCTNLLDKKREIQPGTFEREIDGIRVVYFDTWHFRWWPGVLGPFWMPGMAASIGEKITDFDVVHLHGYRSFSFIPVVRAASQAGIPIVTQPHGALQVLVSSFWLKRAYDRAFRSLELDKISALIALQDSEREQARAQGVPDEKIEIIPNGIDPHLKDNLPEPGGFRKRWGLDQDCPLILFLGRINKIKGPDMLIEAFAQLERQDARLVVAGPDDGLLPEIQRLIEHHHLRERVILTGLLSGPDVLPAYQDADLFVLPSRFDAFPMTVVEACLMGLPMVITEECRIAPLLKDVVAEVTPFDACAFAQGMGRLLEDGERYQAYRANSSRVVAGMFSQQAVTNQVEALYRRVIQQKHP